MRIKIGYINSDDRTTEVLPEYAQGVSIFDRPNSGLLPLKLITQVTMCSDAHGPYVFIVAEAMAAKESAMAPVPVKLPATVPPTEKLVTCKSQQEPHIEINTCREPIVGVEKDELPF